MPWAASSMLKITAHSTRDGTLFELAGRLAGPWVGELRLCWREAASGDRRIKIELREVTFIDAAGRELLAEMHRQGSQLEGSGCMTQAILERIKREAGS